MTIAIIILACTVVLLTMLVFQLFKALVDATAFIESMEDRLEEYREKIDDIRHKRSN